MGYCAVRTREVWNLEQLSVRAMSTLFLPPRKLQPPVRRRSLRQLSTCFINTYEPSDEELRERRAAQVSVLRLSVCSSEPQHPTTSMHDNPPLFTLPAESGTLPAPWPAAVMQSLMGTIQPPPG